MTDLIERYVLAVQEHVPEDKRAEVGVEVRAAIDEMVALRVEAGEDGAQAERGALEELGDPERLAASYHERQRYLVGPGWYPAYLKVLKLVAGTALPIVTLVTLLVAIGFEDASLGAAIESAVESLLWTAGMILLWVTIGFVIAERVEGPEGPAKYRAPWTVDELSALPASRRQIGLADTLATIVTLAVFGILVFLQGDRGLGAFARGIGDEFERMALLNPDLGAGWTAGFFVLIAFSIAAAVVRYLRGVWTGGMLALTVIETVAWIGYIVALAASEPIFNPELAQQVNADDPAWWAAGGEANVLAAIVVSSIVLFELWEAWQGHRAWKRDGAPAVAT